MPQFLLPATYVTALVVGLRRYASVLEQTAAEIVTPGQASGGAARALEQERKLVADWLGQLRPGHELPHELFDEATVRFFRHVLEGLKRELNGVTERLGTYRVEGEVKLWGPQETLKNIDQALQSAQLGLPGEAPPVPPSPPSTAPAPQA